VVGVLTVRDTHMYVWFFFWSLYTVVGVEFILSLYTVVGVLTVRDTHMYVWFFFLSDIVLIEFFFSDIVLIEFQCARVRDRV
jgi:hypothetical protein